MFLVDTHCHLDDDRFKDDLDSLIESSIENGVEKIIIPAANPDTLQTAINLAESYKGVYFACGIHPCDLKDKYKDYLAFASHKKCVAIGECGLDYHYLDSSRDIESIKNEQKEEFIKQIEFSIKMDLPLIVHIRESSNDAFNILDSYKNARGVLHCFNADRILLNLSDRFYYGIGGVATFKNTRRLIEVLPLIPKERIVFETDAPYLTPEPHRGKRNEPSYIPIILEKVASILEESKENMAKTSTENANTLFNLN